MRFLPYNGNLKHWARNHRKNMTPAEKKLWYFLRTLSVPVLRQRIIDNFIVDFYCARFKLVIEVDGSQHYTPDGLEYDRQRTAHLEGYQIKVIRFTNNEVLNHFSIVCDQIMAIIDNKEGSRDDSPLRSPHRTNVEGGE